jgi:hypothetical protein
MDTVQLLGSTLGLGFVAGIRLYFTVLALGLAIRFGYLHLNPGLDSLRILASPVVLGVAGVACVLEFISDKVPWLDSLWDSFHTFIRPIGVVLLGAAALGKIDPEWRFVLALLCGGVTFASHASKAATRLAINHSPEPFSNIGLSLLEDLFVPAGIWLSLQHPLVTLGVVGVFLVGFLWISPKIFRLIRLQVLAVATLIRGPSGRVGDAGASGPWHTFDAQTAAAFASVYDRTAGVRCAAGKGIDGLRNSIGDLRCEADGLVFVTRRNFRHREHRIGWAAIRGATLGSGVFLDPLTIETDSGPMKFLLFKRGGETPGGDGRASTS